jgi:hypothetical protein
MGEWLEKPHNIDRGEHGKKSAAALCCIDAVVMASHEDCRTTSALTLPRAILRVKA